MTSTAVLVSNYIQTISFTQIDRTYVHTLVKLTYANIIGRASCNDCVYHDRIQFEVPCGGELVSYDKYSDGTNKILFARCRVSCCYGNMRWTRCYVAC